MTTNLRNIFGTVVHDVPEGTTPIELRKTFGTVVHDVPEGTTPIELRKTFGTVVHDVPEGTTPIELRKTFATAVHDADVPFLVPNISGTVGISASFDASSQSLDPASSTFHWSWNSVPAGSSFGNSSYPLPDNGVNTYFDMTSNDVLYHFEGDADDSSGNSNNGSMTGISFLAGKIGVESAGYNNSSSKIEPSSPVNIAGNYTIGFWFYNLKGNGAYRTGVRDAASEHAILLNSGNDALGAWLGSGFRDCGFDMPEASYAGWHHILVIGDSVGGTSTYYVNGSQAGIPINYVASTNISIIGNTQAGGQRFADRIDEFAMWSRKLSIKEVRDLFFLQSGSVASDLSGNVGLGETFTFVPDASGTYESNLNMTDGTSTPAPSLSGSVYAYISSASPPGPGPDPITPASDPTTTLIEVDNTGYVFNTYKMMSVQRARTSEQVPFKLGTKGKQSLRLRTNEEFTGSA